MDVEAVGAARQEEKRNISEKIHGFSEDPVWRSLKGAAARRRRRKQQTDGGLGRSYE